MSCEWRRGFSRCVVRLKALLRLSPFQIGVAIVTNDRESGWVWHNLWLSTRPLVLFEDVVGAFFGADFEEDAAVYQIFEVQAQGFRRHVRA